MNSALQRVVALVGRGEVRVSEHGYDELAADAILVRDVAAGAPRRSSSRATRILPGGRAYWCCSETATGIRFTWSGASRPELKGRRSSSPPIGRTRIAGAMTSEGD